MSARKAFCKALLLRAAGAALLPDRDAGSACPMDGSPSAHDTCHPRDASGPLATSHPVLLQRSTFLLPSKDDSRPHGIRKDSPPEEERLRKRSMLRDMQGQDEKDASRVSIAGTTHQAVSAGYDRSPATYILFAFIVGILLTMTVYKIFATPNTTTEDPSVIPVCFLIFIDSIVLFGYLALLPSWVNKYTDDVFSLGLINSAGNVALMVGMPVWGILADRIGVKSTLRVSMLGLTLALIGNGFQSSYMQLFVARCVTFFFAGILTLCKTYVNSFPYRLLDYALRATSAAWMSSVAVGAAVGVVATKLDASCATISFAMASLSVLALLVSEITFIELSAEPRESVNRSSATTAEYSVMGPLAFVYFASNTVLSTAMTVGAADAFRQDDELYVQSFFLFGIVGIFGSILSGPLVRNVGARPAMALYLVLSVTASIIMIVALSPNGFRLSFSLLGFGEAGGTATAGLLMASHVKRDRVGFVNGFVDASGAFARAIAPPVMAKLYSTSWYICITLAAVALPFLYLIPREIDAQSRRSSLSKASSSGTREPESSSSGLRGSEESSSGRGPDEEDEAIRIQR